MAIRLSTIFACILFQKSKIERVKTQLRLERSIVKSNSGLNLWMKSNMNSLLSKNDTVSQMLGNRNKMILISFPFQNQPT